MYMPSTSNGKVDKRALQHIVSEQCDTEKELRVLQPSKKANLDEKLDSKEYQITLDTLAGALRSTVPMPPPPVYQKDPGSLKADSSPESATLASSSQSVNEKAEIASVEKGLSWEGYEDELLPGKTQGHYARNLRHQIFTLYRRLFGIVFIVNMAVFISTIAKGDYNAEKLGLIVVANLFCAILMRQDYVINAFFTVFCAVPPS